MRTPWPQLALFLTAVVLALAAGASARSPARAVAGVAHPIHSARVDSSPLATRPVHATARVGSRFGEPPPLPAPAGGPPARDPSAPPVPPRPPVARWMAVPVAGVDPAELARDTLAPLSAHQELEIPAPRGTPVLAVASGTVERIQQTQDGGHGVWVVDASGRLRYRYAHLQGYREGLAEGQRVEAGDPLGYVGDSGNAVPGHTHLSFAVTRIPAEESPAPETPVDPLPYLRGERPLPR